jgi:hypothetical protein
MHYWTLLLTTIIFIISWVMLTSLYHFSTRENLLMGQFLILALKGVTQLNLSWAPVKWSKVFKLALDRLVTVCLARAPVIWIPVLLCRMGSGSPGNVRWWEAEAEDPCKARLWASRITTNYSWYSIFCMSLTFWVYSCHRIILLASKKNSEWWLAHCSAWWMWLLISPHIINTIIRMDTFNFLPL